MPAYQLPASRPAIVSLLHGKKQRNFLLGGVKKGEQVASHPVLVFVLYLVGEKGDHEPWMIIAA